MVSNKTSESAFPAPRVRRPLSVTLLALGVLTLAGINLLRFAVSLQQRAFLSSLLPLEPLYLTISGLVWAVLGLLLVWGLWSGRGWAVLMTQIGILVYSTYFWLDRIFLAQGVGRNWLFALALNLFLLVIVYWILSSRKAKAYFGALNDR
jgi:uncharacterized membrane protein (DUF2068 family)